jgi:hypothetical protein
VPTAFDYLDPHAVGLLMDAVHHEYDRRVPEHLGTVIAGSFQDELPGTNAWSRRLADEFRTRRGYDLLDHMPALFGTDATVPETKIRADYYAVRAELTEEALFRPLSAWHRERGMLLGSDQSHPARAGYPAQSTQIYTDYFRTHRWYGAAGSDHHGDAKVHSSMAHLYGHERIWIEAFHSSGWGGTLEDTYHWLLTFLRSGANLYNPHASYFGTAGGWFEWAPPSTDWRQPYWKQYPAFSRAVARICSIMSWGGYVSDVAVLHPTATMQALVPLDAPVQHFGDGRLGDGHADADQTQRHYLDLCGTNNWLAPHPGALDRRGISFDVVDDDSVRRAKATDGALRIRDLAYRAVLLPSASVLEEETARRLTELHVGAECVKRVWWNGEPLEPDGGGYLVSARVTVARDRNILEYELSGAQSRPSTISAADGTPLGSFFCLSEPGGLGPRPRFMRPPDDVRPDGRVTYRGRIHVPGDEARAALVVGAASAVTVLLDGDAVARQEKVEYYEADWGAVPMFFRHEPALGAGEHTLEVVADSADARDAVFVDLVVRSGAGVTALVSGAGWKAESGGRRGRTVEDERRRGELQHCHAAVRPHPLPESGWLTGRPVLGGTVWPSRSTDNVHARPQRFRFTVPAGTVSLDLPLALRASVRVGDGPELPLEGSRLTLRQPLLAATPVEVVTESTAVLRGGSAWQGPVRVRAVPAPLPLGDWRELGLGSWSGGVTYARALEVPSGPDPVLDLGRVRGSVEVSVDGEPAGEAFCAPYRFPLPGAAGRTVRLEVTVRGTLAPYLAQATPTAWAFDSQLSSGLWGPVTLRIPSGHRGGGG